MEQLQTLLLELDGLKNVYRKSYISDGTRNENSAEHSWHLAMALMALKPFFPQNLNIDHAIKLALAHDVCEIGAGDVCAYTADSAEKFKTEETYLKSLAERHQSLGHEIYDLWFEYESQQTLESHWVKVVDKLLPFLLNLASEGRTWREQGITLSMAIEHNAFIQEIAPDIHAWMMEELQVAVNKGWIEKS